MKRFIELTNALVELFVGILKADKESKVEIIFTGEIKEGDEKPALEGGISIEDPLVGAIGGLIIQKTMGMWIRALNDAYGRNKTLKVHLLIDKGELVKNEVTYTPGEDDEKEDEPAKEAEEPVKES